MRQTTTTSIWRRRSTHFFSDYDEFLAFRDSQTGETQTDDGESGDAEG